MTLFQFDATVPATNDNPSADQPDMLVNNQSTVGILGVDHVTFNLNNGGQHKAITFNQDASYVPSGFPVNPPQLFTNTVDGAGNALPNGVPELFFYSGSAPQSKNQYVSTANGSALLPGGIIIKWGISSVIGTGPNFTFPVAFPNNCFTAQITGNANAYSGGFVAKTFTPTGFIVTRTDGGSGNTPYNYVAIGN
jgi:hypothetical protein